MFEKIENDNERKEKSIEIVNDENKCLNPFETFMDNYKIIDNNNNNEICDDKNENVIENVQDKNNMNEFDINDIFDNIGMGMEVIDNVNDDKDVCIFEEKEEIEIGINTKGDDIDELECIEKEIIRNEMEKVMEKWNGFAMCDNNVNDDNNIDGSNGNDGVKMKMKFIEKQSENENEKLLNNLKQSEIESDSDMELEGETESDID
eukprot:114221_1